MTTMSRTLLTLLCGVAIALGAAACNGDNKCDQLVAELEKEWGDEEMTDEQKEEAEEGKKEFLAECNKALEDDPEGTKEAIDCFLDADSFEEIAECPDIPGL